jgi:spore germination protein YaaH
LGLINEVLLDLAEQGGVTSAGAAKSLARLKEIQADIAVIKKEEGSRTAAAIAADIERLKSRDRDEYERLIRQLGLAG